MFTSDSEDRYDFCNAYHSLGKAFGGCTDIPPETLGHAIGTLKRKGKFQAISDENIIKIVIGFIERDRGSQQQGVEAEVIAGFKKGRGAAPWLKYDYLRVEKIAEHGGTLLLDVPQIGLLYTLSPTCSRTDVHLAESSVLYGRGTYGYSGHGMKTKKLAAARIGFPIDLFKE